MSGVSSSQNYLECPPYERGIQHAGIVIPTVDDDPVILVDAQLLNVLLVEVRGI